MQVDKYYPKINKILIRDLVVLFSRRFVDVSLMFTKSHCRKGSFAKVWTFCFNLEMMHSNFLNHLPFSVAICLFLKHIVAKSDDNRGCRNYGI